MNEVIGLIQSHRSIRKFQDKPVEESVLEEIIASAQWAPSSSFVQAYSIISIRNPETKKTLAALCGDQPYIETCPVFLVFCADLHRLELACKLHHAEMIGEYTESFIMATVDAALAAQNAMIAAESLGLGGVYIGGARNHPQEISDLLQLPRYVYPVFGICLGYPNQNPEKKPRLSMEVVYKKEIYGSSEDMDWIKEYDHAISEYYRIRTKGKRNDTWTQQMAEKMQEETRPQMRDFLRKRGFEMK